jgi:fructokinase
MNDINSKYKIAGIGEGLWDVFPDGKQFGGAPANFACHCHTLGAEAYVVSCIGNDELGLEGREFLSNHGVDITGLALSEEFETGTVLVTLDSDGKPDYEIKEGVAWDNIPFTEEMQKIASGVNAVCFGSLSQRNDVSRRSIATFLDATPQECLRMFDINIRQHYYSDEVILSSLEKANALKINDEELPLVAKLLDISGTDEEQLKAILKTCSMNLVILTCGPKGALLVTEDDVSFEPAAKAEIIASTVGAGDSFTATAIMGYLNKKSLEEINRRANEVAAYVCTQTGAVPTLPESLKA